MKGSDGVLGGRRGRPTGAGHSSAATRRPLTQLRVPACLIHTAATPSHSALRAEEPRQEAQD